MTSDVPAPEGGAPWYRNFWPWFIVGLLGTSIAGSLVTVAIAYRHRDVDVRFAVEHEASPDAMRVERGAGP